MTGPTNKEVPAKLGKRAKRILIAEDVLFQLSEDVYTPMSTFFLTHDEDSLLYGDVYHLSGPVVQEAVKELRQCDVCAIGAAFVSGVRLFDGIDGASWDVRAGHESKGAQSFFTKAELKLMEQWYECDFKNNQQVRAMYAKLIDLGPHDRMKAVFESIRDNGGRVSSLDIQSYIAEATA